MVRITTTKALATILSLFYDATFKVTLGIDPGYVELTEKSHSLGSAPVSSDLDYVSNNCLGKEDGTYWLKFSDLDSNFKVVKLECSNEYIILDPSKDENLADYFSSFEMWHYAVAGPKNSDPVNWEDWFLGHLAPSNQDANYDNTLTNYLVSPDCNTCDESSDRQLKSIKSSYWMTGNLAKLYWKFFGLPECDMDYQTYECFSCLGCQDPTLSCDHSSLNTAQSSDDFNYAGICTSAIQASNKEVATTRSKAAGGGGVDNWIYKPSIGTNGKFCTCYKPSKSNYKEFKLNDKDKEIIIQSKSQTEEKEEAEGEDEEGEEETDAETDLVRYLSQTDFDKGPYRIRKSGTYIISEDIVFNFGENNEYKYFPSIKENSDDLYPGAGDYRGPYHMGYFAGITVECNDVTIDLNGFSLQQSYETYFAQRFFAIIELSSQQFLPGVGPAFFGYNPVMVSNIVIKNGILGRSSHFGIHGNFPTNVKIENIHIKDFVTHGVHLDGWTDIEMTNVEIGPSSTFEYIRGDFAHARIVLPRLKAVLIDLENAGTADTKLIKFANRNAMTLSEIIDNMEFEMDLVFDYALNRVHNKHSENDYISPNLLSNAKTSPLWQSAKAQFAWENGLPCSSSLHGIFLNQWSASTQTFTLSTSNPSKNAKLTNIKIHDLKHSFYELFMIMRTSAVKLFNDDDQDPTFDYISAKHGLPVLDLIPWNIPVDGYAVFGFDQQRVYDYYTTVLNGDDTSYKNFDYIGSSLSDSIIALTYFSDDWDYLGLEKITDSFLGWVQGETKITQMLFACNKDIMHHAGKGLLGLRIDGSVNVELSNIYIYNLYEETPLGSTFCGKYSKAGEDLHGTGGGGHLRQVSPMQIGFSGNNLNGISIVGSKNIKFKNEIFLYNLNNKYSEGHGISIWPNSEITILSNTNVIVSDVNVGYGLTQNDIDFHQLSWDSRPNRIPESCAIRLENKDDDSSDTLVKSKILNQENGKNIKLLSCNINGHVTCLGDKNNGFSMFGDYQKNNDQCINQHFTVSQHLTSDDLSSIKSISVDHDGKTYEQYNSNAKIDRVFRSNVSLVACFLVIVVISMCVQVFVQNKCSNSDKMNDNHGYGTMGNSLSKPKNRAHIVYMNK